MIETEISIGGVVFPIDAAVETDLDLVLGGASYHYTFIRTPSAASRSRVGVATSEP